MNKKRYLKILFNPVFIMIYGLMLYEVYLLCLYGGLKRHLMMIIPLFLLEMIWVIFLSVRYFKNKKDFCIFDQWLNKIKHLLMIDLWIMLVITVFFGYKIYQTSIPYQGHLSWYLDELHHSKHIKIEHTQFYKTGIEGIFDDLNLSKDDDFYISDPFIVSVNKKGVINKIEGFIYNQEHSYLIDYNNQKMTVWLDNEVNKTFDQRDRLQDMFTILSKMKPQLNQIKGQSFQIKYTGYQETVFNKDDYYLNDDQYILCDENHLYQNITGYCVVLKTKNKTSHFYNEVVIKECDDENHQAGDMEIDQSDNVTLYYNDQITYKLDVIDSALGTRYYAFLKNDEIINQDPFQGQGGQAKGIFFIDENTGFLLLGYGEKIGLYMTQDGGHHFTRQLEQYDYIDLPYQENQQVYVKVRYESDGQESKILKYQDGTWKEGS